MRKQQIIEAMNNGAQLAYNMIEAKHQLHFNDEVYTVRTNTVLSLKKELELVEVKQAYHNRSKTDVMIVKNNTYMPQDETKAKLKEVKKRNEENNIEVEAIELKEEEVKQTGENTFEYKGKKVAVYGEADECMNMAIEGWLYLIPNYEEEYSTIYAEGYNTKKEAVKAIINDSFRRYGDKFDIEEISFI